MLALTDNLYLLLPLLAAFLYSIGAMGLKAASMRGLDLPRITVIANWVTALAFLVFLKPSHGLIPAPWWPPFMLAGFFFLGQIATFVALSRGDVSLATPLMGTKVVLVALLVFILGTPLTWQTWAGSVVALVGIVCLQASQRGGRRSHVILTLVASLTAAAAYAAFDTTVQVWSKHPGVGYARLVPAAMVITAVMSLVLLPMARPITLTSPRSTWGFLALGIGLNMIQSMILITTIGFFGNAAACNIVYGSRGIWSIVIVWWMGHWFNNRELHAGRRVVIARVIGSALIMAAIVLAFIR